MLNIINKHPSLLYHQEIESICQPLKKLNITYFAHVKRTNDKKFSGISSNPTFTEHYLKNKYFVSDIHNIDESIVGNHIVWDAIEFTDEGEKICIESSQLGVHSPFTIISQNPEGVDYYHFASGVRNKKINQIYLANIDLLYRFIDYFKDRVSQSRLLNQAYQFVIDLKAISPIKMTPFDNESIIYDRCDFFQNTHLHKDTNKIVTNDIKLSKRQDEILQLIVHGKTIKEISKILQLSPRTIGHYFDTVKMKFDVSTRSELMTRIIDTGYIKLT